MSVQPRLVDVGVRGGKLRVAVWGERGPVVYLAHGITANHLMWQAVADLLSARPVRLVAPDLRGRGASGSLPPPYGMAAHVADALSVLDEMGVSRALVVGGSMGGYVAVLLAATHPHRVAALGLCDGGVALPVPEGLDPEEVLLATVGPTIDRLDMTFDSDEEYVAFWRRHPALGPYWNAWIDAYVRYDIARDGSGKIRSKVSKEAVMADGRDLLTNAAVLGAARAITCPTWLVRAPRNLLDQPQPLISDEMLAAWRGDALLDLEHEVVADTNHFTLFLSERGASRIADLIWTSVSGH